MRSKSSVELLLAVVAEPLIVPKFKYQTQLVERAMKELTKTSHKVVGTCTNRRDATMKSSMENRVKFSKQE